MVRVILDTAGSGKTKQLLDEINEAVKVSNGNLVCIEPKRQLTFNLDYSVRLVPAEDYAVKDIDVFRGFVAGMYAGNFDITHIFIDNLVKITGESDPAKIEAFLNWVNEFSLKNSIDFTITVNAESLPSTEGIKKFC